MKFFVGVTDSAWFNHLAGIKPDEANFWLPSGKQDFRALSPGDAFLFKLHSPDNFIAGGGFFVSYSRLPLSLAWQAFGEKNGAPSFVAFSNRIRKYREKTGSLEPNPHIGCVVLDSPCFFRPDEFIPAPRDWKANIVRGKTYDAAEPIGRELWAAFQSRLIAYDAPRRSQQKLDLLEESPPRYGSEYVTHARLGQGAFRVMVTDAYDRRCAITGERTLPVLEAAHIRPFASDGPNHVDNGLLLRSDLHILYDEGFLTVTEDLRVVVSPRILEEYQNGRQYYALHGSALRTPERPDQRPSREHLAWHNREVYIP